MSGSDVVGNSENGDVRIILVGRKHRTLVTHSIRFSSGSRQYTLRNVPAAPVRSTTFPPSSIYIGGQRMLTVPGPQRVGVYLDSSGPPDLEHFVHWVIGDEAEVFTAGLYLARLGLEFRSGLM